MKKYCKNFPQKLTVETMSEYCNNGCWNGCFMPQCYGSTSRQYQEDQLIDTYRQDYIA